jgi:hypothetical protein
MPIPDYQTLMLPLLKIASDGKFHTKRDAVNELAVQFGVSEEERKELLPSGNQAAFDNRVGWARTYLKKAKLISYVQRGQYQITERGQSVLAKNPPRIDVAYLRQFPEFLEFRKPNRTTAVSESENARDWWDGLDSDERFWRLYHSEVIEMQFTANMLSGFKFSSLPRPAQEYVKQSYQHRQDGYGYLFGIALRFSCPACGKESVDLQWHAPSQKSKRKSIPSFRNKRQSAFTATRSPRKEPQSRLMCDRAHMRN